MASLTSLTGIFHRQKVPVSERRLNIGFLKDIDKCWADPAPDEAITGMETASHTCLISS